MRFNRDKYKDISIECNGMESCSKITFYINGNFIGNNNINADSNGMFSLKDGLIDVSLMENQIFNINCGNSNKNCEGTVYICKGGLCYCNNIFRNVMDGCSSFKNYVINTQAPTTPTIVTKRPSIPSICGSQIIPQSGDIVICDNNCVYCNINCAVTSSQCESVYVYSAALYTRLDCSKENSCAEMGVYAGNTGIYPDKLNNEIFFERNHYNSFYMDCTGKSSCLKSSVYIKGTFIDGGKIDGDSNGLDGFKESSLVVSINGMNIFDLVCGLSDKNCYSNTKYECQSGMCYCNTILHGNTNGCSHLYTGGVIINTQSPTDYTTSPSSAPTTDTPTILTSSPTKSESPTNTPTMTSEYPTESPTHTPTNNPTYYPTNIPTISPTAKTYEPTQMTLTPTMNTESPTILTNYPTTVTVMPTSVTISPTELTLSPTMMTNEPTKTPTYTPTNNPSTSPTRGPTNTPTKAPTIKTNTPTIHTLIPTLTTLSPSIRTDTPTNFPSESPSNNPTNSPTITPSNMPTIETDTPTTAAPTPNTIEPTTHSPTTSFPSNTPSIIPSNNPTISPFPSPTLSPTISPINEPSNEPTLEPTNIPSIKIKPNESNNPSNTPSTIPILILKGTSNTNNTQPIDEELDETPSSTLDRIKILVVVLGALLILMWLTYTMYLRRKKNTKKDPKEIASAVEYGVVGSDTSVSRSVIPLKNPVAHIKSRTFTEIRRGSISMNEVNRANNNIYIPGSNNEINNNNNNNNNTPGNINEINDNLYDDPDTELSQCVEGSDHRLASDDDTESMDDPTHEAFL